MVQKGFVYETTMEEAREAQLVCGYDLDTPQPDVEDDDEEGLPKLETLHGTTLLIAEARVKRVVEIKAITAIRRSTPFCVYFLYFSFFSFLLASSCAFVKTPI